MQVGDIIRLKPEPWRQQRRLAVLLDEGANGYMLIQWLTDSYCERVGREHLEVVSESR